MEPKAIVYTSNTGYTAQYAALLAKKTGLRAYALNEAFAEARKYYHVTTNLANIPALDTLTDAQLPELFKNNDARQLIHITYGLILNHGDFAARLYRLWDRESEAYAQALEAHIGRHLQLLQVPLR